MDGGPGDTVVACQLAKAVAAPPVPKDGSVIELDRAASDGTAFETGTPHAGTHPLDDQVAFKLGDRSDDDDNGAA